MRLARRHEMQSYEKFLFEQGYCTPLELMDVVGALMAEAAQVQLGAQPEVPIAVVCGPGHNGGDGFVFARELALAGFQKISILALESEKSSELWQQQRQRAREAGVPILMLRTPDEVQHLEFPGWIVDALFGIGLDRPLEGLAKQLVEKMNTSGKPIASIDLPSGLDADRGVVLGAAVKAQVTWTVGFPKPGLFLQEGPEKAGRITRIDPAFPREEAKNFLQSCFLIGPTWARRMLPPRPMTANKSHFGRALLVGGAPGMEGALVLAGSACARLGAGYTFMSSPEKIPFDRHPADFLQKSWKDLKKLSDFSAIGFGPGLGQTRQALKVLESLMKSRHPRVVLDADALTLVARHQLWPLPSGWILTPHAGEMSRILGVPAKEIEADRLGAAREAAKKTGAVILLKGFRTVVHQNQKDYIIGSGNVALAKAGSGDVLTGFITSLLAQGLGPAEAAVLGAYLHGACADHWIAEGHSSRSLQASDLPNLLDGVLARLDGF